MLCTKCMHGTKRHWECPTCYEINCEHRELCTTCSRVFSNQFWINKTSDGHLPSPDLLMAMSHYKTARDHFSRRSLARDLHARYRTLQYFYNFDPNNGYAQVVDKSTVIQTAYGAYEAYRHLLTWYDLWREVPKEDTEEPPPSRANETANPLQAGDTEPKLPPEALRPGCHFPEYYKQLPLPAKHRKQPPPPEDPTKRPRRRIILGIHDPKPKMKGLA